MCIKRKERNIFSEFNKLFELIKIFVKLHKQDDQRYAVERIATQRQTVQKLKIAV